MKSEYQLPKKIRNISFYEPIIRAIRRLAAEHESEITMTELWNKAMAAALKIDLKEEEAKYLERMGDRVKLAGNADIEGTFDTFDYEPDKELWEKEPHELTPRDHAEFLANPRTSSTINNIQEHIIREGITDVDFTNGSDRVRDWVWNSFSPIQRAIVMPILLKWMDGEGIKYVQ